MTVGAKSPARPTRKWSALNSGARVFMADFEDAHVPTWLTMLDVARARSPRPACGRTVGLHYLGRGCAAPVPAGSTT
jgi:hypothetical protein